MMLLIMGLQSFISKDGEAEGGASSLQYTQKCEFLPFPFPKPWGKNYYMYRFVLTHLNTILQQINRSEAVLHA